MHKREFLIVLAIFLVIFAASTIVFAGSDIKRAGFCLYDGIHILLHMMVSFMFVEFEVEKEKRPSLSAFHYTILFPKKPDKYLWKRLWCPRLS